MAITRRFRPGDEEPEQRSLGRGAIAAARPAANPLNVLFFARLCESKGLPRPEKEILFHPTRKWRLDIGWTQFKVALEVHGAVHQNGRHNRGAGSIEDWLKMTEAQILGWIVVQVPRSDGGAESWLSLDTVDLCARAIARQKVRKGQ